MKKLFTLIAAFLLLGLNAYAEEDKELVLSSLPKAMENTTWTMADDGSYATFAWTETSWNSTQLFGTLDYSTYKALRIVSEAGTADHCRLIVKFSDGTNQKILSLDAGDKTIAIETLAGDETKISKISEIRLSGANDVTGDIKISKVVLVAGVGSVKLMPIGIDLKTLTGTEPNWANLINYPGTFTDKGTGKFGNGDGSNESTHVDISAYDRIYFVVSKATTNGVALRSWFWDGTKVVTLFAYPLAQEETADFTVSYTINAPGVYVVKTNGIADLKGVKGAAIWNGVESSIIIDAAFVSNGKKPMRAIDGFRHFSSNKALDFTNMKHVEAYIVPDARDGKVYMKKVEGTVPANTGLILKSDSDAVTITIPVVKTSDAELTNILVPVSEAKTVDVPEKGNNYLYDGTKWVAVSAPTAVPAGSCYLPVNSSLVSLTVTDSPISVGDSGFIEVEGSPYDPDKAPEGGIESATRPDHGLVDSPSDTTENNQQNGTATGINSAEAGSEIVSIVTANGAKVNTLQKGINIVTYSNGKRVKVIK